MKYCPRCQKKKLLSAFGKHLRRGHQSYCKPCKRERDREDWVKHRQHRIPERKQRQKAASEALRKLKKSPCADCGVSYPYYVMDFDHVRGKKDFEVSQGAFRGLSMETLMKEVEKCDVVCAKCHRERPYGTRRP